MTPEDSQLRFVAAALAMKALIVTDSPGYNHFQETASKATKYADALLSELAKPVPA